MIAPARSVPGATARSGQLACARPGGLAAMRAASLALAVFALLAGPAAARADETPARAATVPAPPPAAQPIPYRRDESVGAMALDVVGVLGVSLAVGVGALVLLRRWLGRSQAAPGRRLRVVETVRLTPKSALFLVELDRRTLLIGQQGDSLVVLAPPSPPSGASVPADPPGPGNAPQAAGSGAGFAGVPGNDRAA